jgi:hypothetical protein
MQARAVWAATLLGAALADASGEWQLASYLAFAAVSIAGVVALLALGELVEARHGDGGEALAAVRALLAFAGLGLAIVSSAARGPLVTEGNVPAVATSAIGAMLVLLAFDFVLTAAAAARPRPVRRRRERREPVYDKERRAA